MWGAQPKFIIISCPTLANFVYCIALLGNTLNDFRDIWVFYVRLRVILNRFLYLHTS